MGWWGGAHCFQKHGGSHIFTLWGILTWLIFEKSQQATNIYYFSTETHLSWIQTVRLDQHVRLPVWSPTLEFSLKSKICCQCPPLLCPLSAMAIYKWGRLRRENSCTFSNHQVTVGMIPLFQITLCSDYPVKPSNVCLSVSLSLSVSVRQLCDFIWSLNKVAIKVDSLVQQWNLIYCSKWWAWHNGHIETAIRDGDHYNHRNKQVARTMLHAKDIIDAAPLTLKDKSMRVQPVTIVTWISLVNSKRSYIMLHHNWQLKVSQAFLLRRLMLNC